MRVLRLLTAVSIFLLRLRPLPRNGASSRATEIDFRSMYRVVNSSCSRRPTTLSMAPFSPRASTPTRTDATRYSITVVDFTDAEAIHAERANKTAADDGSLYWAVDVLGSIAYAAWNIRKRGGEITYDAFNYIQRVGGHQLQITNDDQSRTYAGIYLHETLLYILEATVPARSPPPVFFQQSLTLLNDEGETFNYPYIHSPRLRIGGG